MRSPGSRRIKGPTHRMPVTTMSDTAFMSACRTVSASLAKCANYIVYVFDLTEHTYSIKDQLKLLERLKEYDKPLFAFITKQDLVEPEEIEDFKNKHFKNKKIPLYLDIKQLTEELLLAYKKELL